MSEYYRMFLRTAEEGVIERRTDINTGEEALYSNGKFIASSSGRTDFDADLLVEKVRSEPHIIAFGAGHIGKALYDLAVLNDMKMTVLDDRKELLTEERFPLAERHIDNYENLLIREYPAVSPYYVIFTHGHEYDTACLEYALKHKASYIGMIGSKKKTERTFCLLREKGFSEDDIRRVHAPIGLAIGAETPEEIAISIMAEIISAFRSEKNVSVFDADLLRILAETEEGTVIRIIDKHGSAPRERGSMMLVTEEKNYGTIGGGAIEKDAAETAIKMLRENKKHLLKHYSLKADDDLGMVCGGDETLLFSSL